jgi:membrane-bound lytic murein transglycosylase D
MQFFTNSQAINLKILSLSDTYSKKPVYMRKLPIVLGLAFIAKFIYGQEVAVYNNRVPVTIQTENIYGTASDLIYTNEINNLPVEAILWCKDFSKKTNYIQSIYNLGKKYFPKVNKIFSKFNLPEELNVLLPIESFFNKNCISSAGAVGYWQFMDVTAKEFGLKTDSANDERKDFKKSTRAAAKYLRMHYNILHDWYLTVAAYNCGLGNVRKAIAKSGNTNAGFFEIKQFLPKETRNYVMKYIAMNLIYKNYRSYCNKQLRWPGFSESDDIIKTGVLSTEPVAAGLEKNE